jgi:predicted P-loop ATPase
VDTLPILEGAQGIGKSRGLAALGGEWYADIDEPMGSKAFAELIQGKWLVELSELAAMRPSEVERVKAGITRSDDVYRVPFERYATSHPRQCVFAGSTNAAEYLQDSTGNRRFLPVRCGTIDRGWIGHHRAQLFAEAAHRLDKGENWWTMDHEQAEAVRAIRAVTDSLADPVAEYLAGRTECRIADLLAFLEVPAGQWTSGMQRRLAESLRAHGWRSTRRAGGATWWVPDSPETKANIRPSLRVVETKPVETKPVETKHNPYRW